MAEQLYAIAHRVRGAHRQGNGLRPLLRHRHDRALAGAPRAQRLGRRHLGGVDRLRAREPRPEPDRQRGVLRGQRRAGARGARRARRPARRGRRRPAARRSRRQGAAADGRARLAEARLHLLQPDDARLRRQGAPRAVRLRARADEAGRHVPAHAARRVGVAADPESAPTNARSRRAGPRGRPGGSAPSPRRSGRRSTRRRPRRAGLASGTPGTAPGSTTPAASSSSRRRARPAAVCFDSTTGSPASSRNETSGCISITRSSTSASVCTSRIFRPSANACCEMPLPVIVRAISFASANVRASSAARGGVGKTLLARLPPTNAAGAGVRRPGRRDRAGRSGCRRRSPGPATRAPPRSSGVSRPGRRRSGRARRRPSPSGSRRHR